MFSLSATRPVVNEVERARQWNAGWKAYVCGRPLSEMTNEYMRRGWRMAYSGESACVALDTATHLYGNGSERDAAFERLTAKPAKQTLSDAEIEADTHDYAEHLADIEWMRRGM